MVVLLGGGRQIGGRLFGLVGRLLMVDRNLYMVSFDHEGGSTR